MFKTIAFFLILTTSVIGQETSDFSVSIGNQVKSEDRVRTEWSAKEIKDNKIFMDHLETYAIRLSSTFSGNSDAVVVIDGKNVGTFRVKPNSVRVLERGPKSPGKFTFIKNGSKEFFDTQLDHVKSQDLGTVKVIFYPEKLRRRKNSPTKPETTGTGISGNSDQTFKNVPNIVRNNRKRTEIVLHLEETK